MDRKVGHCRLCGSHDLELFLDLGQQAYTGIFPSSRDENVPQGTLSLTKCLNTECALTQLSNDFSLDIMYGDNYGYRSGLNPSMVSHLKELNSHLMQYVNLASNDIIIDIGSNDGTSLAFYPEGIYKLYGIDPTSEKFKQYYRHDIKTIPKFFDESIEDLAPFSLGSRAKVITSISMFYDLPSPLGFAKTISNLLSDDGIWVTEQSYYLDMLRKNSFDTICHEHLEYYNIKQLRFIASAVNLKIIDISFNPANGGSFRTVLAKKENKKFTEIDLEPIIADEELETRKLEKQFKINIEKEKKNLKNHLKYLRRKGQNVYALGASTKGNVLLQYYELSSKDIIAVGEVNEDKFGKFTPGTLIPIVNQETILDDPNGVFIVLPWHFREFFENNTKFSRKTLIYPLPIFDAS